MVAKIVIGCFLFGTLTYNEYKAYEGVFSDDHKLIELTSEVTPIFFFGMTLFGMQRTCQSVFISLEQAKISILIALLRKVILLIPLIYIFSNKFGVMGDYCAD